jgi:hypothetical protein
MQQATTATAMTAAMNPTLLFRSQPPDALDATAAGTMNTLLLKDRKPSENPLQRATALMTMTTLSATTRLDAQARPEPSVIRARHWSAGAAWTGVVTAGYSPRPTSASISSGSLGTWRVRISQPSSVTSTSSSMRTPMPRKRSGAEASSPWK